MKALRPDGVSDEMLVQAFSLWSDRSRGILAGGDNLVVERFGPDMGISLLAYIYGLECDFWRSTAVSLPLGEAKASAALADFEVLHPRVPLAVTMELLNAFLWASR